MASRRKIGIHVVFDVRDAQKHQLCQDGSLIVQAADPDEAIEFVYSEMQRQFNQSDIELYRVRICA